jgi:putative heme-binding domain-containing protein
VDALAVPVGTALASPDRFVRMAAVRVMSRMSKAGYTEASKEALEVGASSGIGVAMAYSLRHPGYSAYTVDIARRFLEPALPAGVKLEAARLMQIGLGDVGATGEGRPEAFEGYTSRVDLSKYATDLEPAYKAISAIFPTGEPDVDRELGRVIAMLQPDDSEVLDKVVGRITAESDPVEDVHWLLVAGRVNAKRSADARAGLATGLLQLEAKIAKRSLLIDTHWDEQIAEIYTALVDRDDELPLALLKDPAFGRPAHIQYVSAISLEKLQEAIAAFVRGIKADPDYAWNPEVVFLLSRSNDPEIQQLVRSKFEDHALRSAVLLSISDQGQESDRTLFVAALESAPQEVLEICLNGLQTMPSSQEPGEQVALARLLRKLGSTRAERKLRNKAMERLAANLGLTFDHSADENGPSPVEQWVAYVAEKFPAQFAAQAGHAADAATVAELLEQTEWGSGDAGRGRKVFETRQCTQCHSGRGAVGPDLNGVAQRFSRDDLFTAIVNPSRDVSPRYQTTAISTTDGRTYTGLVIYESVDYLVIRNATNQTSRIEKKMIEERKTLSKSLMPEGLLKDLGPAELADLYAYLRGMGTQTAEAGGATSK